MDRNEWERDAARGTGRRGLHTADIGEDGFYEPYSPYGYESVPKSVYEPPRRKAGAIAAWVVVLLFAVCAASFFVFEWEDLQYVLPQTQEQADEEAALDAQMKDEFAYSRLSLSDREKYRLMYSAFQSREKIPYPIYDMADASRIESFVKADHPELEDIAQFCLWEGGMFTPAYITGFYYVDKSQQTVLESQLNVAKQECLGTIPENTDDYEKAKAVFEWIARTTDYDSEAAKYTGKMDIRASEEDSTVIASDSRIPRDYGQTVSNVFIDHRAVCAGYARAFQMVLKELGMQCVYVKGSVEGQSHAWCVAKLDGQYYHIDPTWGDPQYALQEEDESQAESLFSDVDYNFFCVTTMDISGSHKIDDQLPLPECTSVADNYYVREGLYFDMPDADRLGSILSTLRPGDKAVMVRCADESVYSILLHDWLESGNLGDYTSSGSYQYGSSEEPFYLLAVAAL